MTTFYRSVPTTYFVHSRYYSFLCRTIIICLWLHLWEVPFFINTTGNWIFSGWKAECINSGSNLLKRSISIPKDNAYSSINKYMPRFWVQPSYEVLSVQWHSKNNGYVLLNIELHFEQCPWTNSFQPYRFRCGFSIVASWFVKE